MQISYGEPLANPALNMTWMLGEQFVQVAAINYLLKPQGDIFPDPVNAIPPWLNSQCADQLNINHSLHT